MLTVKEGNRLLIDKTDPFFGNDPSKGPFNEYIALKINDDHTATVKLAGEYMTSEHVYPLNKIKKHPVQFPSFNLTITFEELLFRNDIPLVNDYPEYLHQAVKDNILTNEDDWKTFALTSLRCCIEAFKNRGIDMDMENLLLGLKDAISEEDPTSTFLYHLEFYRPHINDLPKYFNGKLSTRYRLEYSFREKTAHFTTNFSNNVCAPYFLVYLAMILIQGSINRKFVVTLKAIEYLFINPPARKGFLDSLI